MKYRKKPIVIEAKQLLETNHKEILDFISIDKIEEHEFYNIVIKTLEGEK